MQNVLLENLNIYIYIYIYIPSLVKTPTFQWKKKINKLHRKDKGVEKM